MLDQLSQTQLDTIPAYVEKWTRIGLSTRPADRDLAEQAVRLIEFKKQPSRYGLYWVESPWKASKTKTTTYFPFSKAKYHADSLLQAKIARPVLHLIKKLMVGIWSRVDTNANGPLWDHIREMSGEKVSGKLGEDDDIYPSDIMASGGGQFHAYSLAPYDFLAQECGLAEEVKPLVGFMLLATSAGHAWFRMNGCDLCERPTVLCFDEQGRLHCDDGPALTYPDGFSIYAEHGVRQTQYGVHITFQPKTPPPAPKPALLDHLTEAQTQALSAYQEKWLRFGLSTAPADRALAEQGLRLIYQEIKAKWPRYLDWNDKPNHLARMEMPAYDIYGMIRLQLETEIRARVAPSVLGTVSALLTPIRDRVFYRVGSLLWQEMRQQEKRREDPFRDGAEIIPSRAGQHFACEMARYDFLANECGLAEVLAPVQGFILLAQSVGHVWFHQELCNLCERHQVLNVDEEGRLHAEDGPALAYPGGYTIYGWHGTIVPRFVIMNPERLTIKVIHHEPNRHVRQAMIERYGPERYERDRH